MSAPILPEYSLPELLKPHEAALRAVATRSTDTPVTVQDVDGMTIMQASGASGDRKRLILSATPLLATIDEMEPFVRMVSQGLGADVILADAAHYYQQDKQGTHVDRHVSERTDNELMARQGPHTIAGEFLRRADQLADQKGNPLRSYDEVMAVGHSMSAYMLLNVVDLITTPEVKPAFSYLNDEYGDFMDADLRYRISHISVGELPGVRDALTIDGLSRYFAESFMLRGKTDGLHYAEELVGIRALFKTGERGLLPRARELRQMMPFIRGFRMNTSMPQLIHAAKRLPHVKIMSIRGEKSLIHPAQEAEMLRTGTGHVAQGEAYERFRHAFRAYQLKSMGHNATNSQSLFLSLLVARDRGWLPDEDATLI
jgi:hypothetical protein